MDLTRAHFHESRRWIVVERVDAGGEAAWRCCDLSPARQAVPPPRRGERRALALWSGEARFGGGGDEKGPPGTIGNEDAVTLGGWEGALYLRSEAR